MATNKASQICGIFLALGTLILAACGGDSTSGGNASAESDLMVSTYDDLPVCSDARDGVMAYVKDKRVAYVCVEGDWTIEEGSSSLEDGQAGAVKNKSISGVSQKGPFLKGTTITAYELDGSKSLLQTGRTFSGSIAQDDGRFNLSNVTLKSSYVRLSANGYYRNEVTGNNSTSPITLNAVTDLSSRNTVNVNLLTHLEYGRVSHLMGAGDGTLKIKQVKKQAEKEIFDAFHIDATGFGYSEDLEVFGKTEADAALLAISILLQGDRNESELTAFLAELSDDLSDGKWDDAEKRAEIAESALNEDIQGKFADYRSNVEGWGLSTTVPNFEKYIHRFASLENGLGLCGSDSTSVGIVKQVTNDKSKYYAKSYTDTTSVGKKTRFICVDADSAKWRVATDLEKDRFNWEPVNAKDGSFLTGPITGGKMVWDGDTLRYASYQEVALGLGCTSYNANVFLKSTESDYAEYGWICNGWWRGVVRRKESKFGILNDVRDGKKYYTIEIGSQTWMAENLNFDYKVDGSSYGSFTNTDNGEIFGRYYTWEAAMDFAGIWSTNGKGCGYEKTCSPTYPVRGVCPEGWHLPTKAEFETLFTAVGGHSTVGKVLKSTSGWIISGNGSDAFAFSALPAGSRDDDGNYYFEGYNAIFWSSTEGGSGSAYSMGLGYDNDSANLGDASSKINGFSVRCLKD